MSDEGVSHQSDGCAGVVVVVVRLKNIFFCGSIKDTTDKVIFATHTQQVNIEPKVFRVCCCWESLYTVDEILSILDIKLFIYLLFFLLSCNTVPPVTISSFIPPPHDPKRKRCGQ